MDIDVAVMQTNEFLGEIKQSFVTEKVLIKRLESIILNKKKRRLYTICDANSCWVDLESTTSKEITLKYKNQVTTDVLLEIQEGNIVHKKAKAIVNAANGKLQHSGGVANAIKNAAGKGFVAECDEYIKANGELDVSDIHVALPHKLSSNTSAIINAVGPIWNSNDPTNSMAKLKQTYLNIFSTAEENNYDCIALPLISSKIFDFPAANATSCAADAIESFLKNSSGVLKTITFMNISDTSGILDQLTLIFEKKFGKSNRKKEITASVIEEPKPKYIVKWYDDDGQFKPYSNDELLNISKKIENGEKIIPLTIDNTKYKSGQQYSIDINQLVQFNVTTGFQRKIQIIQNPDYKESSITATDEKNDPKKNSDSYFTITGTPESIITAKNSIFEFLNKKIITTSFDDNCKLSNHIIDDVTSRYEIEIYRDSNNLLWLTGAPSICNSVYRKLLADLQVVVGNSDNLEYPADWDKSITGYKLINVQVGSKEWQRVVERIKQTVSHEIKSIERIQNPVLYEKYHFELSRYKKRFGEAKAEVLSLFHGTRETDPSLIYFGETGFDSCFANSGMWGRGNYFAVNAYYSFNGYCYPSPQGKQLMLAEVLVGIYEPRSRDNSIRRPSFLPDNLQSGQTSSERYASIKGRTEGSDVFIVYDNGRAYPTYLITFK